MNLLILSLMKRLLDTLSQKWPEYLLEVLVLIIGIYGAFALENWNEKRKERVREQTLLMALHDEFESNLAVLNEVIEINARNISAANNFASILSPDVNDITEIEFAEHWDSTFKTEAIYRPGTGVLNEAMNSGSISLISNAELRERLSAISAELQQLRFQEELVLRFRMECYNHLRTKGNFRRVLDLTNENETWYQLGPSRFRADNKDLLRAQQFENDLMLFIGTSVYLKNKFLYPMRSNLEQILMLISQSS